MKKISIKILCDELHVADTLHGLASYIECNDVMDDVEIKGSQGITGDHYAAAIEKVNI